MQAVVRERQCVSNADLVTTTPRADPSLAEEYCGEGEGESIIVDSGFEVFPLTSI